MGNIWMSHSTTGVSGYELWHVFQTEDFDIDNALNIAYNYAMEYAEDNFTIIEEKDSEKEEIEELGVYKESFIFYSDISAEIIEG